MRRFLDVVVLIGVSVVLILVALAIRVPISLILDRARRTDIIVAPGFKGAITFISHDLSAKPAIISGGIRVYRIPSDGIVRIREGEIARQWVSPDSLRVYFSDGTSIPWASELSIRGDLSPKQVAFWIGPAQTQSEEVFFIGTAKEFHLWRNY